MAVCFQFYFFFILFFIHTVIITRAMISTARIIRSGTVSFFARSERSFSRDAAEELSGFDIARALSVFGFCSRDASVTVSGFVCVGASV